MIAIDTNILVHSHLPESPLNDRAFTAIRELASSGDPWAIPWPCLHEFLAVVTNPRLTTFDEPLSEAMAQVEAWMESPSLVLLSEDRGHWPALRELLVAGNVSGGMVHDARIAALCQRHDVTELWTADRDFERFPGLRTRNPLVEPIA